MTANVRCAGRGWYDPPDDRNTTYGYPCGWKGERFPSVDVLDLARRVSADMAFEERATAKPCPHCGGRIELLATDEGRQRL